MTRLIRLWMILVAAVLSLASAGSVPARTLRAPVPPLPLDECDSLFALTIRPDGNSVRLTWWATPGVEEWVIYRATDADMSDVAAVAVVQGANSWREADSVVAAHPRVFYRVAARWSQGDPDNYDVIEDFEEPVTLLSYPGEDAEPNRWHYDIDHAYGPNGRSLELNGNTWKRMAVDSMRLDSQSVWRVIVKGITPGENQAFGIADSANDLWYVLWGSELRRSQAWNLTYQGWYPTDEWVEVDLPVGADFRGRYGYYPTVLQMMFANDNDGSHANGVFRIDEIRDASGTVSLPPIARFRWEIRRYPSPDTMEVAFCSMGCDPEAELLQQQWSFGDGTISFDARPVHRYRSGGAYQVTLSVLDSAGHADWVVQEVADTTSTATRQLSFLFGGDVMMARRYEDNGGIIDTWGVDTIFNRIQPLISSVDLAMCNLECPLTNYDQHHPTKMYYFKGRPEYVEGLRFAGIDYVALANNHNMDYMEPGMDETKHVLDSVGILSSGAGDNDEIARMPAFFSLNGLCVAIVSFCNRDGSWDNEQPFLSAGPNRPGFAMWDRTNMELVIPPLREVADIVIVQVHSGIEYATVPPPLAIMGFEADDERVATFQLLPDTADVALRKHAIDLGADLVINHHPHVVQGFEAYNGRLIAHSMGNFAFEQRFPETFVSMAVTGEVSDPGSAHGFVVHPIYIDRYLPGVAAGELALGILDYITELSRPMRTWMVRQPQADTARVLLDTVHVTRQGQNFTQPLELENYDGYSYSPPVRLDWGGYVVQASVQGPPETLIRIGRDVLLHGNMEAEGATPWDLNSGYERYDSSAFHRPFRSLRLNRQGGGNNSVSTTLLYRMPYNSSKDYSVASWVRGTNTREERLQFEYWQYRSGGGILDSVIVGGVRDGSYAWTQIWENLIPPPNTYWWTLKVNLRAPEIGEGRAWYDDMAVIEWEPWQVGTTAAPFPSSVRYVQVRAPEYTPEVQLNYRLEWVTPTAEFIPPRHPAADRQLD